MLTKTSATRANITHSHSSLKQRSLRSLAQRKEPSLGSGVVGAHLHSHTPTGGDTDMDRLVVADSDPYSARIGDYMSTPVRHVTANMELMSPIIHESLTKFTGLPVIASDDDATVVGILSARDLTKYTDLKGLKVADAMCTPAICVTPRTSLAAAAGQMLKNKVHRLPVVDAKSKTLVGIVTRSDIFTPLLSTEEDIDTPGEIKERELHVVRLPLAENRYEEYDDGDDDESEMDMDAVRW
jgi:CBS domain-containing protein